MNRCLHSLKARSSRLLGAEGDGPTLKSPQCQIDSRSEAVLRCREPVEAHSSGLWLIARHHAPRIGDFASDGPPELLGTAWATPGIPAECRLRPRCRHARSRLDAPGSGQLVTAGQCGLGGRLHCVEYHQALPVGCRNVRLLQTVHPDPERKPVADTDLRYHRRTNTGTACVARDLRDHTVDHPSRVDGSGCLPAAATSSDSLGAKGSIRCPRSGRRDTSVPSTRTCDVSKLDNSLALLQHELPCVRLRCSLAQQANGSVLCDTAWSENLSHFWPPCA